MEIPAEIEEAVKHEGQKTSLAIAELIYNSVQNTKEYIDAQERRGQRRLMHRLTGTSVNRGCIGIPTGELYDWGKPVIKVIDSVEMLTDLVGAIDDWAKEEYFGNDAETVDVFRGALPAPYAQQIGHVMRKFLPRKMPKMKGKEITVNSFTPADGKTRHECRLIDALWSHQPNMTRCKPMRLLGLTDDQITEFKDYYHYVTFKINRELGIITAWFQGRDSDLTVCKASDSSEDIILLGRPVETKPKSVNAHDFFQVESAAA